MSKRPFPWITVHRITLPDILELAVSVLHGEFEMRLLRFSKPHHPRLVGVFALLQQGDALLAAIMQKGRIDLAIISDPKTSKKVESAPSVSNSTAKLEFKAQREPMHAGEMREIGPSIAYVQLGVLAGIDFHAASQGQPLLLIIQLVSAS